METPWPELADRLVLDKWDLLDDDGPQIVVWPVLLALPVEGDEEMRTDELLRDWDFETGELDTLD